MNVTKDSTNVSVSLYIADDSDGTPELGVVYNTAGIDLKYRRDGAAETSITEATLASLTTAHSDGGFLEIGNGWYRFDVPDAAFATGVDKVLIYGTVTGMVVYGVRVDLDDATVDANVTQISGDSTAADNLELQYDGTGLTGNEFPANQEQVGNISVEVRTEIDSNSTQLAAIVADTNELQTDDVPSLIAALNDLSTAQVNAEVDTALSDYDAPTKAEMDSGFAALNDIAATDIISSGVIKTTVGGAIDNVILVNTTTTNTDMVASAPTAASVADAVLDEALSGHNTAGSLGKAIRQVKESNVSEESTVNDGSASTTSFITSLTESTDDHYNDVSMVFIDGALSGQSRPIANYNGTTKTITLDEALTEAPASGDTFIIRTDHVHPVTRIREEIDSNSTQLAAIVADTNELQTDDVPGLIAALNNVSVADLLTTQMTEAYASDGTAPTLAQAIFLIQQTIGDFSISGTTLTAKKLDGSTTAATYTLNDGANPTSRTRST